MKEKEIRLKEFSISQIEELLKEYNDGVTEFSFETLGSNFLCSIEVWGTNEAYVFITKASEKKIIDMMS